MFIYEINKISKNYNFTNFINFINEHVCKIIVCNIATINIIIDGDV
jgi:hypothetical protein